MEYKRNLAAFLVDDFEKNKATSLEQQSHASNDDEKIQSEKVLRSSTASNSQLHEYNQVMEVEKILLEDLIKPLMFLGKYFLPLKDVIKYDPVAKCVVLKKGSILRKAFCILCEVIILHRLILKIIPNSSRDGSSASSIISMGAYFAFIIFNLACFYSFWMHTKTFCDVLNHSLDLAGALHLKERTPSRIRCVRYGVHATWIFATSYVIFTISIYMAHLFIFPTQGKSEMGKFKNMSESEIFSKSVKYDFDVTEIHAADDYNIFMQVISTLGSFLSIYYWMMSFMQFGVWGLYFRQLIRMFYWRIEMKREIGQFMIFPHEIRTYNRIVSVMDEYNKISGLVNLLGSVVIVTYISTSVKHAFSDILNVFQMGAGIHLLLSYIPLASAAVLAAEVQRAAGQFAGILKDEYGRFTEECGDPAETLCGIGLVHYDLSTSSIGFKGLGFYTVSYQFITTIVSVIITYSILVFQLFPQDKSVEPP